MLFGFVSLKKITQMLNLNAGFKELHYMLCMSEARKINSAKKSIEGGCESMNQMQTTKKKAKPNQGDCYICGNNVKSTGLWQPKGFASE